MPIIQEMPAAAVEATLDARPWPEIEAAATYTLSARPDAAPPAPDLPPHPLYYLSLLELITSRDFDRAIHSGWHTITQEAGTTWLAMTERVSDRSFRFARRQQLSVRESDLFLVEALRTLVPDVDDHELRAVTSPPLLDLALWLRHPAERRNIIIPIRSCGRYLTPGQPYTEAQVADALAGPARSLLEFVPDAAAPLRPPLA